MKIKQSPGELIFSGINIFILSVFSLACILPFINIVASSFSSSHSITMHPFMLWPRDLDLSGYWFIFSSEALVRSVWVSIYVTVLGTIISMSATALTAYPLSRKQLAARGFILKMIVFTMMFSGGMIPTFLVVRATGLLDSIWALIIPSMIGPFNLIIMKNFYMQIPVELEESAKMDGGNDFWIFLRIYTPLAVPVIATLSLFYAVGYWNGFMSVLLYIRNHRLWTIQIILRNIMHSVTALTTEGAFDTDFVLPTKTVRYGTAVVATVPILLVYSFAQKHFVKGVMIGSIKG